MIELQGRRALVTGAAQGLGLAIARLFVERGAQVMLADIDEAGHGAGHHPPPAPSTPEEDGVCLLRLRLRMTSAQGNAMGALNDALRRALRNDHRAQVARLLVLKSVHQHRAQETAQALRTLDEALHVAARCDLVRSLVDGDPAVLDMIEAIRANRGSRVSHGAEQAPDGYLRQLLAAGGRATGDAPSGVRPASPQGPTVELLTERELKILRLLKAGLGNRELAQSLFVSEATVKWHLHNIFAKLGVRNRTSALARAQELL